MKKTDWKDTAELIGIAAIVASLIFVGFEVRQNQQYARIQAVSDFGFLQAEISALKNGNEIAWLKGLSGEELSPQEAVTFNSIADVIHARFQMQFIRIPIAGNRPIDSLVREYATVLHIYPGLRRYFETHCEFYQQLPEREIPYCRRVAGELTRLDEGDYQVPGAVVLP